jgi:hypothetical protein
MNQNRMLPVVFCGALSLLGQLQISTKPLPDIPHDVVCEGQPAAVVATAEVDALDIRDADDEPITDKSVTLTGESMAGAQGSMGVLVSVQL